MSTTAGINEYQCRDLLNRSADCYAKTKFDWVLDKLDDNKKKSILNIGCGTGELSILLASAGHKVVSVDLFSQYIEIARHNTPYRLRERCRFIHSSLENFEPQTHFDAVVATDVFEHIQDDESAVRKSTSFLKPGGLFLVTVPAIPWLFGFHDANLGHFRRYQRKNLFRLLNDNSQLTNIKLQYFGLSLIPVSFLYSCALKKEYPVASVGGSFLGDMLKKELALERYWSPPLGISLFASSLKK